MSEVFSTYYFLDYCSDLTQREKAIGKIAAMQALKSEDTTKVGAVLYTDKSVLEGGHNHLSDGIDNTNVEINEDNKSMFTLHAEMDVITKAIKNGHKLEGTTMMVVGKCPCTDCAKTIVAMGIKKVICPIPDLSSRWSEQNNNALKILMSGGVELSLVKDLAGTSIGLTCPSKYIV